jgi:peptidoglycan hydrolase CwlO-like protein
MHELSDYKNNYKELEKDVKAKEEEISKLLEKFKSKKEKVK